MWLETYAILLTLLILMLTLASMSGASGGDLVWIYLRLFLVVCLPVLAVYGIFQPLPSDLVLVLEIQAVVLTLILVIVLGGGILVSIGLNRFLAYGLLIVVSIIAVVKILPLLH
jgi:hypothetical protein